MKKILNLIKSFITSKPKWWWIVLIVIVAFVGLRLRRRQTDKPQLTFEQPTIQDLTKVLEVSGHIDAKQRARLRFATGGKVVYLGAQEGDAIKKWQTIATIDQQSLRKSLEKDLNLYMKERWDWEQQLDDIEDRTIDQGERRTVDKNQWDLENEVIDVEIIDIAIRNTVLNAPFAGILVSSPTAVTGVNLLATDIFEIVNPDTLVFRGVVDEGDISLLQKGQTASLELDAFPDETISTNVSYIAFQSTQTTSGTAFIVEFPITTNSTLDKYRIGMNGDLDIELDQRNQVLTVPLIATREEAGVIFVDVKTSDQAYEAREIEVGMETDEWIEVLSGLSLDDSVLIPTAGN